tara:strand:- start:151 stop:474 length:324 start_codon:yes stop_codon:yes gene_type:complete
MEEKNCNNTLKDSIIEALGTVYDPEIPVSIWELGLVYNIDINEKNDILITMTLTTPNCPEAETIPDRVAEAVSKCENVGDVRVEIVWEPTWTQDNMSEAARLELGFF